MKVNLIDIIETSNLDELFQINLEKEEWVWINKEIFLDIILNAIEYDFVDEKELYNSIENIKEEIIIETLEKKFKKAGWMKVNQKLFEKLDFGFVHTKDIETYIFSSKKAYNKKIIAKSNELDWILKAMAVDSYQHTAFENKTLLEIYEEYFNENGMVIEKILQDGEYEMGLATWKLDDKSNLFEFYKQDERFRQWSEGNSNFAFYELNK